MNRYWLIGIGLGLGIFLGVILHATHGEGMGVFFDIPGIALVFGGTLAAGLVAWPPAQMKSHFKVTMFVLKKKVESSQAIATEIAKLVDTTNCEIREIEREKDNIKNMFLKDAVDLILDRVEPHHVESILKDRIKQNRKDYDSVVQVIKTLAKYPPAFGMIGTIIGLVALMANLGKGGADSLGPAMAIGLVATFYGVALSNLLLMPLADNVAYKSAKEILNRQIVLEGAKLILEGTPALIVQERLNSLLKFTERIDIFNAAGAVTTTQNKKGKVA